MNNERQTILIVDDEPLNINLLSSEFSKTYKVLVAKNGEQALKRVNAGKVDLILLDIIMPDMDGYEVCAKLKTNESTKNIPVIFITSMDENEEEARGLLLGAVDYIKKPFYMPIVKARVGTHLDLRQKSEILENLAALDGLTQLNNRRSFDEKLKREWNRALRNGSSLALIMIDVDNFKAFNDNYGHGAGDGCLKEIAKCLKQGLYRSSDFIARYGGEEFVIVLPKTDVVGASHIAQKLLSAINALNLPHQFSSAASHVTISLGVAATIPNESKSPVELIDAADQMLYAAKKNGRNKVFSTER